MFGLNRSLKKTIGSLERNVLAPFWRSGVLVDVFFHTYSLSSVSSERAKERGVRLGGANELVELLGPRAWVVTSQEDFDETINMSKYFRFPATKGEKYKFQYYYPEDTVRNLLRQLNSIRSVTALLASTPSIHDYAAVIMTRPDLLFLDRLDVSAVLAVANTRDVLVPYWHSYHGLNDRIQIAAPAVALELGNRFAFAERFAATEPLHAEKLLRFAADAANLTPRPLKLRAVRVRATGVAEKNDLCLYGCNVTHQPDCHSVCSGWQKSPSNARLILGGSKKPNSTTTR